ncbi:MAG: hypothetical protein K6F54_10775 [Lachnospiraceae bacterium]|nr:hypothetical protein [Lachnospiraceae bacterium]
MEQRAITQMKKSQKMTKAEEKYRQAQAVYAKAVKDENERVRKIQNRHKYMMGGCVLKYFPEGFSAYEFNEPEMNRIVACAFSFAGVTNLIKTVVKERPAEGKAAEKIGDQNEIVEVGDSKADEAVYDEIDGDDTDDENDEYDEGEN